MDGGWAYPILSVNIFYLLHASMYITTTLILVCFLSKQKSEQHYLHSSTPFAHRRSEDCSNLVPKVAECSPAQQVALFVARDGPAIKNL